MNAINLTRYHIYNANYFPNQEFKLIMVQLYRIQSKTYIEKYSQKPAFQLFL